MIIRTATFPKGPARHLKDGDIVQVIYPNGRFRDCYVADLEPNDEYFSPQAGTIRTGDMILAWMEENSIEPIYQMDTDGGRTIELYREDDREPLVSYPWGEGCLRQAVEFLMDQEEQQEDHELIDGTRDALDGLSVR